MNWEKFQESSEYLLWKDLYRVANEYDINEDNFFKKTDLSGEYWEPFFDRLFKLGCMLGYNRNLKEIKMDWMRPILYFGAQSNGIIEFDGRRDEVDKGAISNAILVKFSFKSIINSIQNFSNLDEKNFYKEYINFKKDLKYYFIQLSKFVKDGFNIMHQHVKLVLKPLLDLRKSGYRLFSLEQYEKKNIHLTIFNDKKDLSLFIETSRNFFKWEKYKQSRDSEGEKLNEFINQNTSRDRLQYHFSHEKRPITFRNTSINPYATNAAFYKDIEINNLKNIKIKNEKLFFNNNYNNKLPDINKRNKTKKEDKENKKVQIMIFPNISNLDQPEPTRLKHEAYQIKFEEGLHSIIEYLNEKQMKDFPYTIDTHKIFVNIKYVPNGLKESATYFYINQLVEEIELLKQKCYEMKLNGLSRVLMPITENVDIINVIKNIFDLHVIIDNVMGNYLLHEQYMFIYNSIKFLVNSTMNEQIEIIKNRYFMEELIPKYVFFQSLCYSVKVLEKMKKYYKEEFGRIFNYKDSYQISEHDLEQEDNELIFAYEIYGPFKRFFVPSLQERKQKYDKEVKKFGRFWLMEGFFNKDDKKLWLEAIEMLSNINELVREDIRDSILYSKEEKKSLFKDLNLINNNYENILNAQKDINSPLSRQQSSSSVSTTKIKKKKSKINIINVLNSKNKSVEKNKIKKKKSLSKKSKSSFDFAKININSFRPPNIWNFPIYRLRQLQNEELGEGRIFTNEIRNVDPTKCYVDGRIQKFNIIFNNLYNNMKKYWNTGKKADTWDYFYDKVLKALRINYVSDKSLKAEERAKQKLEEDLKKKEEEEEKKIDENINKLTIKKEKENELKRIINSSDSSSSNLISKEQIKKILGKAMPIKKIKIIKGQKSKLLLNRISLKDEGNTNETTT